MSYTAYQIERAKAYAQEWLAWGLSTDAADRPRAEAAIMRLRGMSGITKRPRFVWRRSPMEAFIALREEVMSGTCGKVAPLGPGATLSSTSDTGDAWWPMQVDVGLPIKIDGEVRFGPLMKEIGSLWNQVRYWIAATAPLGLNPSGKKSIPREVIDRLCSMSELGQWGACRMASILYSLNVLEKGRDVWSEDRVEANAEVTKSCGPWWSHEEAVFVSERPSLICLDEAKRLHSIDGPAFEFRDGQKLYYLHGVEVPAKYIEDTEALTPSEIDSQWNVEVRRVLIDMYGFERYMRRTGGQMIHEGRDGRRLWWRMGRGASDEPTVMVEVINSTPEPDGTLKHYWLRVPPYFRNADEAVAWTFGLSPEEYEPRKET